jgi:hypothetical protein
MDGARLTSLQNFISHQNQCTIIDAFEYLSLQGISLPGMDGARLTSLLIFISHQKQCVMIDDFGYLSLKGSQLARMDGFTTNLYCT